MTEKSFMKSDLDMQEDSVISPEWWLQSELYDRPLRFEMKNWIITK